MFSFLTSWERRLSELLPNLTDLGNFAKQVTAALLAGEAVLCLGAVLTRVMLHGDGSYFIFVIAAGDPWGLKWKELATRASTYVLTVLPAALLSDWLEISGEHIAVVNGLTFYGVQWIQYLIVAWLARRQFPQLLLFPILQYGLSTGLGFGFPSEILLAPGFFWICLFALIRKPVPWALVYTAFAGLVFSHDLAIPVALLVLAFAWRRRRQSVPVGQGHSKLFVWFAAVVLAIWLLIRLRGGGAGGDNNAIYVFDPRRVLDNPVMWLIAVTVAALNAVAGAEFTKHRYFLWLVALTSVFLAMMASRFFNFAQGRYDSARTLIAVCMAILGLLFIADQSRASHDPGEHTALVSLPSIKTLIVAVLSLNLAASALFLYDWNEALKSFTSVVNSGTREARPEIISFEQARAALGSAASKSNERMDFSWSWPYRSIVVANDFRPVRVIVDVENIFDQCHGPALQESDTSRIPPEIIAAVSQFACAQAAPADRRYFRHWLLDFWKPQN